MVIGEVFAALGVFLGLIFVGWEIRQNTMAARASALQNMGIADSWRTWAVDPESAEIVRTVIGGTLTADDWQSLSETDRFRIVSFYVYGMRLWETTWRQVELGLLDKATLNMFGSDAPALGVSPSMSFLWPEIRPYMSPDYAEAVEAGFPLLRESSRHEDHP